jgi:C_GCAxxG_C_C family probable redox protein
MSKVDDAVAMFGNGYACSQAILAVYGEPFGLDCGTALKVAGGFAGGMRMGATCGAVTGAYMVLGLAYCPAGPESRAAAYEKIKEFTERFRRRNGSVSCSILLGVDMSTPEGVEQARQQGLFQTRCPKMVKDAAEILGEML